MTRSPYPCPECGKADATTYTPGRFQVDGRDTAKCFKSHDGAGPIDYFVDDGSLARRCPASPLHRFWAKCIPGTVRGYGQAALEQFCGIRVLTDEAVQELAPDDALGIKKTHITAAATLFRQAQKSPASVAVVPQWDGFDLVGFELRAPDMEHGPRPGDADPNGNGKTTRMVGKRGCYIPQPHLAPKLAVVIFEGTYNATEAVLDAHGAQSDDLVFMATGGANVTPAVILRTMDAFYPDFTGVLLPDNDAAGLGLSKSIRRFGGRIRRGKLATSAKDYRDAPRDKRRAMVLDAVERALDAIDEDSKDTKAGLPSILVAPPESNVAEAAREALSGLAGVYVRRGSLVHVRRRTHADTDGKRAIPAGFTSIEPATPAWTREQLSKCATWERTIRTRDGFETVPSLVPEWGAAMILDDPGPRLPELLAVTMTPVFLADGTIHSEHGKLKDGVLYLGPSDLPKVPSNPTLADAQAATERLHELVSEFPWALLPSREQHRAAWMASLLTVVARYAIPGPVPWIMYEANSAGSGKGLLAQGTSEITTGAGAPILPCPGDEAELRKSILTVLNDGTRLQVVDEVYPGFGGRTWNALSTSMVYRDRLLGISKSVELPHNTVWFCTGNNVTLASDTTRRCLPIRLEPMEEHPEDRDNFKIKDLLGYVHEHQAELLRDALTILAAFHAAGRPASGLKPWGSFEAWTNLVRDAIHWATGVDCDCRGALASVADLGRLPLADLVAELRDAFGTEPFTVGKVIEKAIIRPELRTALDAIAPAKDGKFSAVSVGKHFATFRRRPMSGYMLDMRDTGDRSGSTLWCIRSLDAVELKPQPEPLRFEEIV